MQQLNLLARFHLIVFIDQAKRWNSIKVMVISEEIVVSLLAGPMLVSKADFESTGNGAGDFVRPTDTKMARFFNHRCYGAMVVWFDG